MKKSSFIIGIIVILLEIFVFNFSFIKSLFYNETKINLNDVEFFDMKESTTSNNYYIESNESYFVFDINKKVNNIYLDVGITFKNSVDVFIDYTDDSNSNFDKYGGNNYKKTIVKDIEKSKYIDCYYLGNTHKIKVIIDSGISNYLEMNQIVLNKRVPLFLNYLRMSLIFSIFFISYNYMNNTKFKRKFDKNYKYILFIIIFIFSSLVCFLYKNISNIDIEHDYYSNNYKEALMNGKLDIDIEGLNISNLDNIYDFTVRNKITTLGFDTSYYNGKIYMYFGILPALIMGLTNLSINNVGMLFSLIGVIFSSLFIDLIISRYLNKTSKGLRIILIIYFLFNSRLLLLISFTRFYEVLIISAYSLCMIGLYLFLKFYNSNKNIYLFFGSLFLSLSLLCRPNMIVTIIFGVFLIYKKLNKKNMSLFLLPYFIIGIIIAYLNYIRFGNIFEFGIKYQLGIIDNSYLKLNILTILNGIFCYLFRMPVIDSVFPYIHNSISMIPYNGFYFNTSTGNGIIIMSIIGVVLPFIKTKITEDEKKLFIICFICGFLLLVINNTAGGSIKRYTLEFAWLFLIPIILYSIRVFKQKKVVLLLLLILSCIINFLVVFDTKNDDIKISMDNLLYYKLQYF